MRQRSAPVSPVEECLAALSRSLWFRPWRRGRLMREARDHLLEAVECGLDEGLSRQAAEERAVARFGSISGFAGQ